MLATVQRTSTLARHTRGSIALTPNNMLDDSREATHASGNPAEIPQPTSHKLWRRIILTTSDATAPNASLTPISRVRRTTPYMRTPYNPTHAISSPTTPKDTERFRSVS